MAIPSLYYKVVKMKNEFLKAKGVVQFELLRADGSIEVSESENMVVTAGLGIITNRMIGAGTNVTHMSVGATNTAADTTQTALLGAIAPRVSNTSGVRVTTTVSNDAVQYTCTFAAGVCTGTLVEAGLFDALTGGNMFARTVFGAITKAAGDSLTITWKITFS
jgi:hypothetical protein